MQPETDIQIDQDGNVSGASESGYTKSGLKILVGVLYRGNVGFKITNPPSGYMVGKSYFMVPGKMNEAIEEALTSVLPADEYDTKIAPDDRRVLAVPLNGVNHAYVPTGKDAIPDNEEIMELYRYENKFLPRLTFKRDQRTLMPQWLAEIFVAKAPEVFEWAHIDPDSEYFQQKFSHLPFVPGFGPNDYQGTHDTRLPSARSSPVDEDLLEIPPALRQVAPVAAVIATPPPTPEGTKEDAKGGKKKP